MDNCATCAFSDTINGKGKTYQFGRDSIRFEEADKYFCLKKKEKKDTPVKGCPDYETKERALKEGSV